MSLCRIPPPAGAPRPPARGHIGTLAHKLHLIPCLRLAWILTNTPLSAPSPPCLPDWKPKTLLIKKLTRLLLFEAATSFIIAQMFKKPKLYSPASSHEITR